MAKNHHIIFKKRPGVNGEPAEDNFGYEECDYPCDPQNNEVLLKTLYLSIDPAMRCRMNEETGVTYIGPFGIGDRIGGFGGVGVVVKSANPDFQDGDVVHAGFNWQWVENFLETPGEHFPLRKIDSSLVNGQVSLYLSILSLTSGLTSYLGVKVKGHVTPGANQTMVVSGAAGACGSLAGQIGKLEGCSRVVGICGSEEKCQFLTEELGYDSAINYKTKDVSSELQKLCPSGVDVYFDNVGGDLSNTVIKQMNTDSHVILCGQIAVYNKDVPYPPPIPEDVQRILTDKNITRDRYLVLNYPDKFESGMKQIVEWTVQGKLKVRETIEEGLQNAGKAFVSMMKGGNIGKQLVHVGDS
ncbi:prostaglandin reductase 2-like isoform X1 [Pecten maximus]|uniref:prostaglandin reductase 2-like isoform X1 n=2 Tax=Pecten maximus TaxID=6579 RepID=UPI001458B7D3|nr:prostaglandin reductase 2-like isoform X1 [Pecten maximus]